MPKSETKDFAAYVEKNPTPAQQHFVDWVQEVTGYDPAKARTKADAFAMGARLCFALRMDHQRSEENQARLEEARAAREDGEEAPKPKKAAKKARPKTAAEPEPEELDAEEDEAEEEPAPKRARKGAPRPAKAAKKTAKKAARRAAPVEETDEEDDEELEAPF